MTITDFKAIRSIGKLQQNSAWYKKFCNIWDSDGPNAAQKFIRTKGKVSERLKAVSTTYVKGKPGNAFNRHELYALRHPEKLNVCICGNFLEYNSTLKDWQLGCSVACAAKAGVPKKQETCRLKYGVENPSQVEKFKEKRTKTIRREFGVENAFQSTKIKRKIKRQWLEKHGVENPSQLEEVKDRKSNTMRKHYGESHWTKAENMKHKLRPFDEQTLKKCKSTMIERYGVENPFQSKEIQETIRMTLLEKYGADNAGMIPNGFKAKKFTDRFGKTHIVQGYEPLALEFFNARKNVVRIETGVKHVPRYRYKLGDKLRNYYPDILVFTESKRHVIEVKSEYTLLLDIETNLKKFRVATKSCTRDGNNFWLFCYMNNGTLIRVRNPKDRKHLRDSGLPV